jgi:cephalosporin hydroxylase
MLRYVSDRLVTYGAKRALAPRLATDGTVGTALDVVYDFEYGDVAIAPMQIRAEIETLLELLVADPPRVILELGTARGGTLFLLSRVAKDDATLVSVDIPGGAFGGGYPPARAPLLASFAREQQSIQLIRGDSHSDETVGRVERALGTEQVDFLLIDGDHSGEGVRRDFAMYSPFVRQGGWIALHDIVPGWPDLVGGVPEFWGELKATRTVRELVQDWSQGAYGIGLIKKDTAHRAVG